MVALPLASSQAIDNGITLDMLHCVLFGDTMTSFSNDDTDLAFIIDDISENRMRINILTSTND